MDLQRGHDIIHGDKLGRSFREYIREAWRVHEPSTPFVPGFHVDAIAEHLEAVTNGQIRNLLINMPPRHGKSILVSVLWPTWVWATRPHLRWLYSSYALQLSIRDSIACRRIVESPWYQARWGHAFQLASDQSVKSRFDNTKKGYRIATSVGGSATGEGGDVIVCDDPHNVNEADSELIRQGVLDWWDQTMSTRLNNPNTGARVVVMQRVHQKDLAGHLLSQGDYDHLMLPAEFTGKRKTTSIGWSDPRKTPGELLWPKQFGPEALGKLKKILGTFAAAGQLQQTPVPSSGGAIKNHWWRWYGGDTEHKRPETFDQVIQSWDLAMKDLEDSDYTVGLVIGRKGSLFYLLDCVHERMDAPAQVKAIKALKDKWPTAVAKLIEDKANGPAVISLLRIEVPGIIPVKADASTGGKQARLSGIAPLIEAGQVYLPKGVAWADEIQAEASAFPLGDHDDLVDALSQGLAWMLVAAYMHMPEAQPDTRSLEEQRLARIWAMAKPPAEPEQPSGPGRYSGGGGW
jgi:predicted phage terminase large subunit-like protein